MRNTLLEAAYPTMHHVEIVSRLESEHIDHLEDLIEAATKVDGHEPIGEHKFLRLRRGDDLATAILAYEEGDLVGYAHTLAFSDDAERRVSCELVVHPEHRRNGIGGALLERVIDYARSEKASRLDLWAYNDSAASRSLAGSYSLKASRRLLHMHRHPGEPPPAEAPEGASVRALDAGEEETLLRLNNRIFEGHPENGSWTLDDVRARTSQAWFNAKDVLMLEVDRDLAGFCWVKVEERVGEGIVGEIYVIGTAPEYQGRGLGRYLLSESLEHLAAKAVDTVAVYVDESNEAGVALYESFQFHYHHVDVCYTLPLTSTSGAAPLGAGATGSPSDPR